MKTSFLRLIRLLSPSNTPDGRDSMELRSMKENEVKGKELKQYDLKGFQIVKSSECTRIKRGYFAITQISKRENGLIKEVKRNK